MKYRGFVQKGAGRGRSLGFPTANIVIKDTVPGGIYAARVTLDNKAYDAAVYIDTKRKILEANLLDFSDDLYGKEIEVELLKKIREDEEFHSDEDLHKAITEDIQRVRRYFIL